MNRSTVPKPWEFHGSSFYSTQNHYTPNTDRLYSAPVPHPGPNGGGGGSFVNGMGPTVVPPIPPRSQTRPLYSESHRRTVAPMYSIPYYQSPYSNFQPYRYGNYNRTPGYYPTSTFSDDEPTIADIAQESTAPAFQSIESFVNGFASIATMLESTYQAIQSSFRAVVEVADHFGRVKQIVHTLAVFRFLKWTFRRILYLIGISKMKPEQIESIWNSVVSEGTTNWAGRPIGSHGHRTSWPIVAFLGFILAAPYLVWKFIGSLHRHTAPSWAIGDGEHFIAISEYDFEPASKNELRLRRGNRIRLAPATLQPEGIKGWVLASDAGKIGLVPVNYIKVIGKGEENITVPELISIPNSGEAVDFPNLSTQHSSPSMSRSSSQSTLTPN